MDNLSENIEEKEEEYLIIEDFNARTGNRGSLVGEEEDIIKDKQQTRKSKDEVINKEGRILIQRIEERRWMIINGSKGEAENWTYVGGNGVSTINYMLTNEKAIEEVEMIKEENRIDSDHMLIEVEIKGTVIKGGEREDHEIQRVRSIWMKEGIEYYREKCEGWESREEETNKL